ncbi:MAG: PhnD/SsuA/transferrin family substrate-binding protein [Candidatus Coatesbacteria bacterium]|nr:MAG: PhnD/SsuA/transferrin family substrate-binding protein [Candidatus Coatesbacteria bacterium]
MIKCLRAFAALIAVAALLGGCGGKEVKEPIKVALGPTFDAAKVDERFGPLSSYLEEKMEQPVEFTGTNSVEEFGDLVKGGGYWFVFADPVTYFEVSEYCVPIAKPSYVDLGSMDQGSIIIKEGREKEIINVPEMKGSSIMIVGKHSLGGYLSQKLFFLQHGLDIDLDFDVREAPGGDPEAVIAAVAAGEVDYGMVPIGYAPMEPGKGAIYLTVTDRVPVEVFAYYQEGDKEVAGKLKSVLKGIPKNDPALEPLGIENFTPATQAEYDGILMPLEMDKANKAQRLAAGE